MQRSKTVDEYLARSGQWQPELVRLRNILNSTELDETVKWGGPCYTYGRKNVVGIGGFKAYFGLWFYQGALLEDDASVLVNAQQGKTKALRQWRMTSASDIKPAVIRRYVAEAIRLVEAGREIKARKDSPIVVPDELRNAMRRRKGAAAAFNALRAGVRREYADYVASAKRDETKRRRVEKILPMILAGKGLNDKYR